MKNAIIECDFIDIYGVKCHRVFQSDSEMEEYFLYNEIYEFIEARKIVLLQIYNKDKKVFEWV
jgi:hypothetical protein